MTSGSLVPEPTETTQAQLVNEPAEPAARPAAPALQVDPAIVTDRVCASGNSGSSHREATSSEE